jgi:uncharacterized protein (TIGR02145 family)
MRLKLMNLCMALCCLCVNAFAQNVPDYVPTESLVAWYPFNGNANDESGNANDGENMGAELTVDRFGLNESAFEFENTRIEIANSADLDQFKSISFWFSTSSTAGNQVMFKQNIYSGHVHERVSCAVNWSGNAHFAAKEVCDATWQYDNVGVFLNDGMWHHYVGVLDSIQKRLYIDGVLLDESSFVPETMCSGADLIIGQEWDGVPYDFIGTLDDFGFWNRALIEDEILALYNAQFPFPGCTDMSACNFSSEANEDDGSCIYPLFGDDCEDGGAACGEGTTWDANIQACVVSEFCQEDLDGDGVIGINDLMQLLSSFGTMCEEPESVEFTCGNPMNYHGYDYATVQIGEQCWFAENLRTAQYSNGDEVPHHQQGSSWLNAANAESGAWAHFSNDSASGVTYGKLYNWYVMVDERGICPTDWHAPENAEWSTLVDHYGGSASAAIELKGNHSEVWFGNGTDGFNALPGGFRDWGNATFFSQGTSGDWWTSSHQGSGFWRGMDADLDSVHNALYGRAMGNSIRCLKDTE